MGVKNKDYAGSVENSYYTFIFGTDMLVDSIIEKTQDAFQRRFIPKNKKCNCEFRVCGEEDGMYYGFAKYDNGTIPYICALEPFGARYKVHIYTSYRIKDTKDFDFDDFLDTYITAHPQLQNILALKHSEEQYKGW